MNALTKRNRRRRKKQTRKAYAQNRVDYVISAHGEAYPANPWRLPEGFRSVFYTDYGTPFSCPKIRPNQICWNPEREMRTAKTIMAWKRTIPFDVFLTSDLVHAPRPRKIQTLYGFRSGVKECHSNQIVVNLEEEYPDGIWFSSVIDLLATYHATVFGSKIPAYVHCLFCLGEPTVERVPPERRATSWAPSTTAELWEQIQREAFPNGPNVNTTNYRNNDEEIWKQIHEEQREENERLAMSKENKPEHDESWIENFFSYKNVS